MKRTKYHYIYKITNKVTGKYYVGMHSTYNMEDGYFGSGKILKRSIAKYGIDAHAKEILLTADTRDQLVEHEKRLVNEELVADPLSMNIRLGGEGGGGWTREQQRENNRKAQQTMKLLWQNDPDWAERKRQHSRENFQRLREEGKIPPPTPHVPGKFKHTEESKQRMSRAAKGRYSGGKNPKAIKVKDQEGNVFDTLIECAAYHSVHPDTISRWIRKGKFSKV